MLRLPWIALLFLPLRASNLPVLHHPLFWTPGEPAIITSKPCLRPPSGHYDTLFSHVQHSPRPRLIDRRLAASRYYGRLDLTALLAFNPRIGRALLRSERPVTYPRCVTSQIDLNYGDRHRGIADKLFSDIDSAQFYCSLLAT